MSCSRNISNTCLMNISALDRQKAFSTIQVIERIREIINNIANATGNQAQQIYGSSDAANDDEKRRNGVALVFIHDVSHERPDAKDRAAQRDAGKHVKAGTIYRQQWHDRTSSQEQEREQNEQDPLPHHRDAEGVHGAPIPLSDTLRDRGSCTDTDGVSGQQDEEWH